MDFYEISILRLVVTYAYEWAGYGWRGKNAVGYGCGG
tara:strand:+ start:189 stop:299 length:111 start_codon:yes stop_codon:yes gene_type:complete